MQAGAFFKSLEFFSVFTIFMHPRHQTSAKTTSETPRSSRTFSAALIFAADLVVGVIEISRKGANSKSAGPDFTSEDLGKAIALSDEDSCRRPQRKRRLQLILHARRQPHKTRAPH
jgi:hypothetical protein